MENSNNFTIPKYNLQKNPLKETQKSFKIFITSVTNLKFQHKKPKYHVSKKSLYKNRPNIIT